MDEVDSVIDEYGGWPGAFEVPAPAPPSIEDIVKADESLELEFKATFQWDVKEGKQNKDLQKSVLKTLAAFMNTEWRDTAYRRDGRQRDPGACE